MFDGGLKVGGIGSGDISEVA